MHVRPALLALAMIAVAVASCADDEDDGPTAGTVTITIAGIEESVGHDVAAVMYDGLGTGSPDARGIGGFGVEVDADPFSTTQTIATPVPIDDGTRFPYVSGEPLIVAPGDYTIMIWIAEGLGPYSRWVPADSPGLGGCRMDITVEPGRPTSVTVDGIPPWTGSTPECDAPSPSAPDETSAAEITETPEVDPDADGTPVAWEIDIDDWGPGVHTVHMIVDFGPVPATADLSGRLIWGEAEVALCGISRRHDAEEARLGVGDIFQTREGCGENPTAMQDAFDELGLPDTACVAANFDDTDHEYCAPLPTTHSADDRPPD